MGEAELGRLDIPTCEESVKKSFQTLHRDQSVSDMRTRNRPQGCLRLVVKLFA